MKGSGGAKAKRPIRLAARLKRTTASDTELQEARGQQAATAEILKVIARSPSDVQPVFEAIVANAARLIGGFTAGLYRFVDGIVHLEAATSVSPAGDDLLRANFPRPIGDHFAVALAGQVLQIADIEDNPNERLMELGRLRGFRSILYVPLKRSGISIGVIAVSRQTAGSFAAHHIELLQTFADQAVIAIQNARLFNEVQDKSRDLEEALDRYRTLVDHASDAFFLYDEDATVLDVNRQACENLGYRRDELIGMTAFDYDPDLTPALLQRIRERLRAGKIVAFDGRHRRKDGTVFPVEVRIRPLWHEGQLRAVSLDRDITERKRAENALRASERRFRTFADHATDAFLLLDEDWTVLDVNRQACVGLGYSSEELIGKHKSDFDVGLDDKSIQRLKQRMVEGETITFETQHRRKDGTSFPVEVRVSRFEQDGGRYLCLVRDISERKRADDELRASEERFRTLVRFSFDVYWESDAQHRFTRQEIGADIAVAPATRPELGKARWEVPYLEPDEEAWQQHRQTLDAHLPFRDFEVARPAPDGGKRYVSVSGLPIFDERGCFVGYRGVGRDITQRKNAEAKLRESEEIFRTLVQFSFDVYWETDAQHRFTRQEFGPDVAFLQPQDREWVDAYAHSIGKRPWELPFLEPDAEAWRKHREAREAHQPFRDFEVAFPAADGGKIYISISGLPMFDKSGTFTGYRGVARDITDRKRADEALRRSEAYLAGAHELSQSAAFAHNLKENLYWSEGLYRIWGFDPSQGIPSREDCFQRMHPGDRDRVRRVAEEAARQKQDYTVEYRIILPDGTLKHLRSIGHPSYSLAGELVEVIGTALDVTERKRAQEEHERLRQLELDLAHMSRLSIMGQLTASLAHEVLHPIATARNNARAGMRFLEMSPPNLAEVMEALRCVTRDADRAKDIVGRIRDHIKKAPPRIEPFDLNEAIDEVLVMVRGVTDRNGVSVRTSLMDEMPYARGDRVQLQQVFLNLILNAVDAMSSTEEEARELTISSEPSRTGGILIAVRDSGPGIDSENLDQIFKPLHTTKTSGLGMGLSICRSIIDAHGGQLWAEANQPRGAVFRFTLPRAVEDS